MTLLLRQQRNDRRAGYALLRRLGDRAVALLPGVANPDGSHWITNASLTPTAGTLGPDGVRRPGALWFNTAQDSANTIATAVDSPVGFLSDGLGTVEAPGKNATQATGANKPVLRRGVLNTLLSNGVLNSASWNSNNNVTVTNNYATAPDGTTTAARVQVNAANGALIQGLSISANTQFTQMVWVKSNTGSSQTYQFWNGSASIQGTATTDWRPVTPGASSFATGTRFDFGSPTSGADLLVWRPGAFVGVFTPDEIRAQGGIPLTTTVAASSALGNYALEFDGNRVLLAAAPFQPSEDHILIASAINRVSDTASKSVLCIGNAGQGFVEVSFSPSGSIPRAIWKDDAGAQVTIVNDTPVLNAPVVITGRKVGNTRSLRINGITKGTDTTVLGASVANTMSVGARFTINASGSSLFGLFFDGIVIRGTLTDAELLMLERFVAAQTGPVPNSVRF
ncbi:hypothetical protein PSQ40_05030 [Curvibacter sp. HBC61]|uniref:Uncharacterized protein n=1 Tax=Curvibacter cyanobacteriorum TaxID=3026422 RepID=A0ABT5MV59_9BURK|nr:hypothetical protein [Curvibacter sp. HBC61]MDD0837930.1 hypothetical protein [Curvibacter sp. HBC61]